MFTGQTVTLRTFLNKLASFELPVLVREVEVDRATAEDAIVNAPVDETATEEGTEPSAPAPSVVIAAPPKVAAVTVKPAPKVSTIAPIVAKPLSKFTVTVEYLNLVTPAVPAEAAPADAKPTP